MHELDYVLKHYGVKGMRWGVRRTREQIDARLRSSRRERSWKNILKDMDNMTNEEMNQLSKRISLENDLKRLSKKGRKTDKEDYLRRDKMSDRELSEKVNRLRTKETLKRNISESSKSQRDLGMKLAGIAGPLAVKYVLTGRIGIKDVAISALNPVDVSRKALKGRGKKYATDKLKENSK